MDYFIDTQVYQIYDFFYHSHYKAHDKLKAYKVIIKELGIKYFYITFFFFFGVSEIPR